MLTTGDVAGLPTRLSLDYSAFKKYVCTFTNVCLQFYNHRPGSTVRRYNSPGTLIITNTLEKFKSTDKEQLLKETSALVRLFVCACTIM